MRNSWPRALGEPRCEVLYRAGGRGSDFGDTWRVNLCGPLRS